MQGSNCYGSIFRFCSPGKFSQAILLAAIAACLYGATNVDDVLSSSAHALEHANYKAACDILQPASAQFPNDPNIWNMLGICESELGRTAIAERAFERGLKLAPKSVSLLENSGLLYFRKGDFPTAKNQLARAVSFGSSKPGVAFSLAASEIRTGQPHDGLADLIKLEPALSNQAAYWTERGWVEWDLKQPGAATSFDRALSLDPNDVRALNGAASIAEADNNYDRALSLLLTARKASPDDLTTLLHLASICLRRDLTVDAMDALKRAYTLAPQNNLALFLYARVNISIQHWQEAHDLFTLFDRRVPRYAPAQFALGWLDIKMDRLDEARTHLDKSLALDPSLVDARYQLGQLDLDQDRTADARRELEKVLAQQPGHAKANIAMGDLLLRSGDLTGAKARYEVAIHSDPDSGPAHYKLSTILIRQHDAAAAYRERELGAKLNAQANKGSRTVLVLAEPDGQLLTGPLIGWRVGNEARCETLAFWARHAGSADCLYDLRSTTGEHGVRSGSLPRRIGPIRSRRS